MTVEKVSQQNFRVRAPRVSHQAKAVLSGMRSCPRGQTPVGLLSQCSDAAADGAPRTFSMAVNIPAGVGETGLGAVEIRWRPPPAAG